MIKRVPRSSDDSADDSELLIAGSGFDDSDAVAERCRFQFDAIIVLIRSWAIKPKPLVWFAPELLKLLFGLARVLYALYLTRAEEIHSAQLPSCQKRDGCRYLRKRRQARTLGTWFGKIRYWRTYMHCPETGRGYYPLDDALGMTRDGFTLPVLSRVTRLASRMSYEAAAATFMAFNGWAPSTRTIEEVVLGFGVHAREYLEQVGAPIGDGDTLVIQIDSKGAPTATEQELRRRRGKRKPNPHPESKRHRGRAQRKRLGPKKRKKKGDKSKNARMSTVVVMYTLRSTTDENGNRKLLGPLNVRIFGSFAPKRYAYQTARREAIKRGFGPSSGKLIQFVNDGDDDLEFYRREYFKDYPEDNIIATADLPHVLEYLWSAGTSLHKEGSGELHEWVNKQKKRLFESRADLIRRELKKELLQIPLKGPGNKGKRTRIEKAIKYLTDNAHRLDYKRVAHMDLELASGMVEGVVKNLVGKRFDHGGMRWIVRRAEALLQLRCIELNGQWEDFTQWLASDIQDSTHSSTRYKFRRKQPAPLPKVASINLQTVYASEQRNAA